MAKIKGIQLKAIKNFQGRQGYGLSANLYFKGKKVGFVIDEANGGAIDVMVESPYREEVYELINERIKEQNGVLGYDDDEAFINELIELTESEKILKREIKKGAKVISKFCYHDRNCSFEEYFAAKESEMYSFKTESAYELQKAKLKPNFTKTYRTLEDFIIA